MSSSDRNAFFNRGQETETDIVEAGDVKYLNATTYLVYS